MSEFEQTAGKRPFWQFHLLTAVILTLSIGVMLGINLHRRLELFYSQGTYCYGWPIPIVHEKYPRDGVGLFFTETKGWIINLVWWGTYLALVANAAEFRLRTKKRLHPRTKFCVSIGIILLGAINISPNNNKIERSTGDQIRYERYGFPEVFLTNSATSSGQLETQVDFYHALTDALVASLLLLMFGTLSEWHARRREARTL